MTKFKWQMLVVFIAIAFLSGCGVKEGTGSTRANVTQGTGRLSITEEGKLGNSRLVYVITDKTTGKTWLSVGDNLAEISK